MKKLLLLTMVLCLGIMSYAQNAPQVRDGLKFNQATYNNMVGVEPIQTTPVAAVVQTPNYRSPNAVSVMDIGSSANAYGFGYGGGQKTIIYYNGDLNTLTNLHRMGGELDPGGYSGDLGYDYSTDGGQTWTNMVECYVATEPSGQYYADAARYPQAVIYNPEGNTDPTNSWVAFFAPNLDATNGTWGGYSYGVAKIGSASNVDTTKNLLGSTGEYFQYIPDGMDINRVTGTVLVADLNQDWASGSVEYTGEILLSRGVWSDEAGDIVYEKILIDAPVVNIDLQARPANIRVAYAPDGSSAWIVLLCDNGENEPVIENQKTYYPVLYKSEDDGETWSDPINVQMDGPDGLPGVLNYMTDAQWDSLFVDPDPLREEVPFTSGFDCDLVIDANGNPHIAVAVGIGDLTGEAYTIGSGHPYFCLMDIYTADGGDTWAAIELGRPENFRGTFGDLTEDNRICAATNWDGTKVFFSYLDTDPEVNPEDNNSPDIWVRGFDPIANMKTADGIGEDMPTNVTFGSAAMWQSYMGTLSSFVIQDGDSYTLPLVYEQMTPEDPGAAVQFKYIKDFSFTDADFTISVGPTPLLADFEADNTSIEEGATVNFTDMSTGGAAEWYWEFDGGEPATSTEQNPSVVYATAGDYDVTLTVTNGSGDEAMKTKEGYIMVSAGGEPPVADFVADKTVVAYGEAVTFTDMSTGATSWSWEFAGGEPATSNEQNPVVTWSTSGMFTVKLTATNEYGENMKEMADYIEVHNFAAIAEEFAAKFNVYPNPTNGQLNIAYSDINEEVEVSIIDNVGRIVAQRQITPTMGSQVINIDLSDLNKGIYQVQFTGAESTIVKKVVVQ